MAVKSWSETAADNDDADATISWVEGQAPSTVNDSARAMMAAIASWYALIKGGVVTAGSVGGTGDAITLTCSPTVAALASGQLYTFVASAGNTGAVTLAVDGLTATAIRYKDVALISGDIATGDTLLVRYNGTRFQLVNPPRLSGQTTDWATDATGGAVADLLYFADASENNASNKVTVQKFYDVSMAALTAKGTPVAADYATLADSAASNVAKKSTLAEIFQAIISLTAKATPVVGDTLLISDSAASNAAKRSTITQFLTAVAASQTDQETATSLVKPVTPGTQQFHPSAPKAWVKWTAGGTTITASYNVDSITRHAAGDYTVTFGTDFSSGDYVAQGVVSSATGNVRFVCVDPANQAVGSCRVFVHNDSGTKIDPSGSIMMSFLGDQ